MQVELSVIVPVKDEEDNIAPLVDEIVAALDGQGAFEIIVVDDGSTDSTARILHDLKARVPQLRPMQHAENCGQSAAVRTGVLAARGQLIVTIDGDGQNDPADIPRLLEEFTREAGDGNLGMVGGQRAKRQDSFAKKYVSRLANRIRRRLLNDDAEDSGCGLKLMRREAFLRLPYFDHMHRFMPALMKREGYEVRFLKIDHRPRLGGRSKYGIWDRFLVSLSDILGVAWLNRRGRKPSNTVEL